MSKFNDFFFIGMDSEIVSLSKYSKGWNELNIPKEYKNKANFEMYCYLKYSSMDAEAMFLEKIRVLSIT